MHDHDCLTFLPCRFIFTSYTDSSSNSSMDSKYASMPPRAVKLRPKPQALLEVAEATEKAKVERFLRGMAMYEEEQGKQKLLSLRLSRQTHFLLQQPRPVR